MGYRWSCHDIKNDQAAKIQIARAGTAAAAVG
jgi:hypothetical protein